MCDYESLWENNFEKKYVCTHADIMICISVGKDNPQRGHFHTWDMMLGVLCYLLNFYFDTWKYGNIMDRIKTFTCIFRTEKIHKVCP